MSAMSQEVKTSARNKYVTILITQYVCHLGT